MIGFLIGVVLWATVSCVLGFVAAIIIRIRGEYEAGETFGRWFRRVAGYAAGIGYGVWFAGWFITYMWRVRSGEIAPPAWLEAPMWFVENWWVLPILFMVAVTGYLLWWDYRRKAANQALAADDGDDYAYQTVSYPQQIAPPPPMQEAPTQPIWGIDRNAPHWQQPRP